VSDHTRLTAEGLAAAGDKVFVWSPAAGGQSPTPAEGVFVRREFGDFRSADLWRVGRALNKFATRRRLLVQWVPHGYGFRSMNIWFCFWLWARAFVHGDEVTLIVHEPFLAFGEGSWKQDVVAVVQRLMTIVLLSSASRVWTTIPTWQKRWRPYALGRRVPFGWLPVSSTAPVVINPREEAAIRARHSRTGLPLIGHFGTYGKHVAEMLRDFLPRLLTFDAPACTVLLMGHGSEIMCEELLRLYPRMEGHLSATGVLTPDSLSYHLAACDLLVQPYPDGVSTRRTSVMAGLAHGLPVVTTKGILTERLWEESGAVVLVTAEDISAMVLAVHELLRDVSRRKDLALKARQTYMQYFDLQHLTANLRRPLA
jgi:glycosyltransferase involved in cell wall biosynthesis